MIDLSNPTDDGPRLDGGTSIADINLDDPPVEPPEGCSRPDVWRLARSEYAKHRRNAARECVTCDRWRMCNRYRLAQQGLLTALGQTVRESGYWVALAELAPVHGSRA